MTAVNESGVLLTENSFSNKVMQTFPIPDNESSRLEAFCKYQILDTEPEVAFDDLTNLAASICHTPIALVSLVDADRQWFKSRVGLDVSETPRNVAFCGHAILNPNILIVPNALKDERFVSNPLVVGEPHIRFYAGVPLLTPEGHALGTICVIDFVPRELGTAQIEALQTLGRQVVAQLELRRNLLESERLIQEARHREAALRESEERFRMIANSAPVLIWIDNLKQQTTFLNQPWIQFLGPQLNHPVEDEWKDFIHADDRGQRFESYTQAFDSRTSYTMEYRLKRCDGVYQWFLETGMPRFLPDGTFDGLTGSCIDITDRKQVEVHLEQTNAEILRATRLKDEFLANMSHELRTPLNAILGMAEALQEDVFGESNAQQIKAIQTIERSGAHLLELINDILDVAKIESGQIELECTPTGVIPLCQSSVAFIKQQALKKRIQIEIQLSPNLPDIVVDERRIRQVLINLLNNAVKFTPEGGRITLAILYPQSSEHPDAVQSQTQLHLRIAVIDTGIGIAPEKIDKLFQPFVQIDSALNRKYQGTGLGLCLVKRIVEMHDGRIGVTSEVGVGSCFTVDLPCIVSPSSSVTFSPQADSSIESSQVGQVESPLILLAEDNEANIMTISSYLNAKGYRLLFAKNGQEAITLAKSKHPDLILMDIQMPDMDGLDAIQNIRCEPNLVDIPIIALTALAMPGDREKCLNAGSNDYLTKPVNLKHLAQRIQQLL